MPKGDSDIAQRKRDHLELTASGEADFRGVSTLLDRVHLIHQALPERGLDDIDLSTSLAGRSLRAPVVIAGMTGGTDEALVINRDLARAADRLGLAFGLGSQRAMDVHPELLGTFAVREAAPNVVLFGNIGVVQARDMGIARVRELCRAIDANALCVHLNPAMELIQDHGDRDFRGATDTLRALAAELGIPVIAKETGCGLSRQVARTLRDTGIKTVDVSGAGGTSWVGVEARRAAAGSVAQALGEELWDWGIPTAVSVAWCVAEGLEVIATGGLRTGSDVARAMALGASAGGFAAPVLRAHRSGGYDGVVRALENTIASLRAVCLLSGVGRASELRNAPRVLAGPLREWLADLLP